MVVSENLRTALRSESGFELTGDSIQVETELMSPLEQIGTLEGHVGLEIRNV